MLWRPWSPRRRTERMRSLRPGCSAGGSRPRTWPHMPESARNTFRPRRCGAWHGRWQCSFGAVPVVRREPRRRVPGLPPMSGRDVHRRRGGVFRCRRTIDTSPPSDGAAPGARAFIGSRSAAHPATRAAAAWVRPWSSSPRSSASSAQAPVLSATAPASAFAGPGRVVQAAGSVPARSRMVMPSPKSGSP